ncbi:MAG: A/G-specific adenine glycosylase [Clostridia bacterium]
METPKMATQQEFQFHKIVEPLLEWYGQNARILPWRENKDPYRVWVSEIMLQQTRVEAVKPYFERFLEQLPTLEHLAAAEEEVLLKLWEGLGYYTRVRNLQKAAQMICEKYEGRFPETYEEILSLPGIGPYTAGAISSISFEQPVPAVDGNVLRVVTRLMEDSRPITDPTLKQQITEALAAVYPEGRCGDFTQSLMELGAIVCTPNGFPNCACCPLRLLCGANQEQTQLSFPVQREKQPRSQQEKTVFLLCFEDQVAVCKRRPGGLLGGLWEFPNTEGFLTEEEAAAWLRAEAIIPGKIVKASTKTHVFTHIEWHMESYLIFCKTKNTRFLWLTREELANSIALPTAFKKFMKCLDMEPGERQ